MSDADADDATLPDTRASTGSSVKIRAAELGDRYRVGDLLGRGGMGEVRHARDLRFERDVAVKLLRDADVDDAMLARFFREARVQGVLDHPAVVPVHDLGIDTHGNPYFVMKKLTGTTLADVLGSTEPAVRAKWPRVTLLARLVDVCFAIDFAHERGVIHRDLKPANIMLGDYNDTYVIDWGLARVGTDVDDGSSLGSSLRGASENETRAGDLLGTPGYMSPEQARGDAIDSRTDIFALGCVLYEILVGKPALPRGLSGIQATLEVVDLSPSASGADVPPELDALCRRATSGDRAIRPSARALADGVQAYLDGDRDLAKRRDLAEARARLAKKALDDKVAGDDDARAVAMREAGGALALDPENVTAAGVLSYLLIESEGTIPAEALAAADHERSLALRQVLRFAYAGYAGFTALLAILLFVPLHHTWPVVASLISCCAILLTVHKMNQQLLGMRSPYLVIFMVLNSVAIGFAGIVIGPLFLLPWVIIGGIAQFMSQPVRYPPFLIPTLFWLPIVALVVLEMAGILPSTFEFRDGSFVVTTWVFDLTPGIAVVLLIATGVIQTLNSTFAALSHRRAQARSQDRIHAQTWHLKRLLPKSSLEETGRVTKIEPGR